MNSSSKREGPIYSIAVRVCGDDVESREEPTLKGDIQEGVGEDQGTPYNMICTYDGGTYTHQSIKNNITQTQKCVKINVIYIIIVSFVIILGIIYTYIYIYILYYIRIYTYVLM